LFATKTPICLALCVFVVLPFPYLKTVARLPVAVIALVFASMLSASTQVLATFKYQHYPLVVLLPALVVNMGLLEVDPIHGALFSFVQLPW